MVGLVDVHWGLTDLEFDPWPHSQLQPVSGDELHLWRGEGNSMRTRPPPNSGLVPFLELVSLFAGFFNRHLEEFPKDTPRKKSHSIRGTAHGSWPFEGSQITEPGITAIYKHHQLPSDW